MVGAGARAGIFLHAATVRHAEHARLVGLCDPSQVRMDFWNRTAAGWGAGPVPTYRVDPGLAESPEAGRTPLGAFDRMLDEQRPDTVIVCSVDATHHAYIVRALERGCAVVTEKPMTTDAPRARAILEAVRRTGGSVRVAFNYRFAAGATLLRQLVLEGRVGTPLLVDFMWTLDTRHGADYFRRWHREKDRSGGLLVHKASHHFDLVNFWLDSVPEEVQALGGLRFYGRQNARARGEERAYERYTGEPAAADDPFAFPLDTNPGLRGLYLEAEGETGYLRDRNVFGDDISIEDTVGVLARYRSGAQLHYSLVAYSPWEGLRVCITGTRGRVELFDTHGSHTVRGQSAEEMAREQADAASGLKAGGTFVNVFPMFGAPYEVEVPRAEGSHGGGDLRLLEQIFLPEPPADPFGRSADHRDGAASIALGVAANEALARGAPVRVDALIPLP